MKTRYSLVKAAAVGLAWLTSACGAPSASHVANVFGPDARITPPDTAPYTAVGRLDSGCSGTLIGGHLVLTAAHCLYDSTAGGVQRTVGFFRPDLRGGRSADALWVQAMWLGTLKPEDDRVNDWGIAQVETPTYPYGQLPVIPQNIAAALPFATNLVGYSADRNGGNDPSAHLGCLVVEVVDGKLFHACDGTAGVSGGPLLNNLGGGWAITGMTVSEYRNGAPSSVFRGTYSRDYANVAVPADRFAAVASALVASVDRGGAAPAWPGVTYLANPNRRPPGSGLAPAGVLTQRATAINGALATMQAQAQYIVQQAAVYHLQTVTPLAASLVAGLQSLSQQLSAVLGPGPVGPGVDPTAIYQPYFTVTDAISALSANQPQPTPGVGAEFNLYLQRIVIAEQQLAQGLFF